MSKAWEWLQRKWDSITGWVWFYFIATSHLINGMSWNDAQHEAILVLDAIDEQRHRAWLEAEKERKAEVRKAQAEIAEELRTKILPEVLEKRSNPEYVEAMKAEMASLRQSILESGVEVVQLLDAMDEIERLLDQTNCQGTGQARVA